MFQPVKKTKDLEKEFAEIGGKPIRLFLFGDNMSGKTYKALRSDKPENIFLVSMDGKAQEQSDKAQTIDITTLGEFEDTIKFLKKQPRDKVVVLDILSRLDDVVVTYINEYFKVPDFQQASPGYNSMQGWGMHSRIWQNIAKMIHSLPQTRVIITDHTLSVPDDLDATGKPISWNLVPSLYGVRPNKPQLTTRILDIVDVVIRTIVKRNKYSVQIESSRGEDSEKRAFEILKIEE